MIESIGLDVGNISIVRQTHSHKKQANVALMTHIINTCDPKSYANVKGKPKWEQAMQNEMDTLKKNCTQDLVTQPPGKNVVKC